MRKWSAWTLTPAINFPLDYRSTIGCREGVKGCRAVRIVYLCGSLKPGLGVFPFPSTPTLHCPKDQGKDIATMGCAAGNF